MSQVSGQGVPDSPRTKGRKSIPWLRDPVILARIQKVERLLLAGRSHATIAVELGVDEGTVRNDLKRLNELWLERTAAAQDEHRARVLAELEDVRVRALAAAEWDQACERAVLFDDLGSDNQEFEPPADDTFRGRRGSKVHRDAKGSAQFRGQKAQALAQARQATMDKAKLLGLVVDKVTPTNAAGEDLPIDELMARFSRRQAEQAAEGQA